MWIPEGHAIVQEKRGEENEGREDSKKTGGAIQFMGFIQIKKYHIVGMGWNVVMYIFWISRTSRYFKLGGGFSFILGWKESYEM